MSRVTRCQKATSGTESMFVWDNVGHVNVMLTHELSTGGGGLVNCQLEGRGSLATGKLWTSVACQRNLQDAV